MALTPDRLARFNADVVLDALEHASSARWLRRAAQFEDARPKPTDYTGKATAAQLAAADARCAQAAQLCRHRAGIEAASTHDKVLVLNALVEVAA